MKRTGRKKEWSILAFCAFLVGVFPPILFLFDKPVLIGGFPLSFLYLFGFWAVMIGFIAIGARRRQVPDLATDEAPNTTAVMDVNERGRGNE
ncbi:MAG: hypothetical protein JKY12_03040 [Sneathiella sp.]|nr:hypothetical protein [Sneathiella sp.]